MRHCNRFTFQDVHLLGEYLCQSIDEEWLARCLFMNSFSGFGGQGVSSFLCILLKKSAYLFKCEVGQFELILDIERGNRPIVVELRDALDSDDADAMRTLHLIREINLSE